MSSQYIASNLDVILMDNLIKPDILFHVTKQTKLQKNWNESVGLSVFSYRVMKYWMVVTIFELTLISD